MDEFVAAILFVIVMLFVMGGLSELASPGNLFFGTCSAVLPVIAGFIIGYHFGTSEC